MKTPLAVPVVPGTRQGFAFPVLRLGLALAIAPALRAGNCCSPDKPAPAKPAAAPAACCRETPPAAAPALTDRSIYQLDTAWTNDRGNAVKLAELRGRPVVAAMFFASCQYACPMIVSDMTRLRYGLPPEVRDRAVFLLVSFDHERDTVEVLRQYRERLQLDPKSWLLLRGRPQDIQDLAAVLGVRYQRDAGGQFTHSNLITVLNAEGEIVHQKEGLGGAVGDAAQAVIAAVSR